MIRRWIGALAGILGLTSGALAETTLRIAAASNLHVVAGPMQEAFTKEFPEINLEFSHGSSGNLVAQIRQGAPFDVFLSADLTYPQALIEAKAAAPESLRTFAYGQLVLWPRPDSGDWAEALRDPSVRRIAIAQPDTAPFGIAAREVMCAAGVWEIVESKIIFGENVAQALHFAESGNTHYAFVAASLLVGRPQLDDGLVIPEAKDTLAHGAVVVLGRPHQEQAKQFLAWLTGDSAREVFATHGYRLP